VTSTSSGTDIQAHPITSAFIDTIFQETWLLALAIRNIPGIVVDKALYQHCESMIEQVQKALNKAGAPSHLADEIMFAHCVFLDEAVMTQPDTDLAVWYSETPLQGRFLDSLHGGEYFYEHIKKLLREPAPSEAVLGYSGSETATGIVAPCLYIIKVYIFRRRDWSDRSARKPEAGECAGV
jgi:type VI secretion system protein ImpK